MNEDDLPRDTDYRPLLNLNILEEEKNVRDAQSKLDAKKPLKS